YRHEPRDGCTYFRAVLHDERERAGNGARAVHRLRDREAKRGIHLGVQRAQQRKHVQGVSATRGGATGSQAGNSGTSRRRQGQRDNPAGGRRRSRARTGQQNSFRQRIFGGGRKEYEGSGAVRREAWRENSSPVDGHHHAGNERTRAGPADYRAPSADARALYVWLYGQRAGARRRSGGRTVIFAEAIYAGGARSKSSRRP